MILVISMRISILKSPISSFLHFISPEILLKELWKKEGGEGTEEKAGERGEEEIGRGTEETHGRTEKN